MLFFVFVSAARKCRVAIFILFSGFAGKIDIENKMKANTRQNSESGTMYTMKTNTQETISSPKTQKERNERKTVMRENGKQKKKRKRRSELFSCWFCGLPVVI